MQNGSRSYSYDDHGVNYVPGDSQVPQNYSYSSQTYSRGVYGDQQDSPYYLPNQVSNVNTHASAPDPRHYRSATSHGHRPSRSVADPRYYPSNMASQTSSSNTTHQSSSLSSYYSSSNSQYSSTHHDRFIPTPSELANSYNYSGQQMSQSPSMYSTPGHHQRQHRQPSTSPILTTRGTRTSHSQTSPISPTASERYPCEICGKTFSRSHDRKRHHETQHIASPVLHRCRYCRKEFSRADSLKRHLDNGCDEAPSSRG